jgi:hypothetical protein
LITGLIGAIPKIIAAIPQIVSAIINAFKNTDWLSVGKNIIMGIVNGLKNMGKAILDAIVNIAKSAFNGILNFFGIHSPSRLMRDEVGMMIGRGLAKGIDKSTRTVAKSMGDLSQTAFDSFSPLDASFGVSGLAHYSSSLSAYGDLSEAYGVSTSDVVGAIHGLHSDLSKIISGSVPQPVPFREFRRAVMQVATA